ncbi:galactosyl transferase GMA12/MNN10 family-domain-containing protein [Mariannaea sp. PMI_226]|nr:galactosyl transferase GMA12/MNN10 family-domain-containing protein [Mariannaea sp. PMI_226]
MQFAYPPRKRSHPPPFRPRSALPLLRRSRLRTLILLIATIVGGLWYLSSSRSKPSYQEHVPSGSPPVVVLTVVDSTKYTSEYIQTITYNREQYALRHDYETMVVKLFDYDTKGAPQSWGNVIALRHAMTLYPDARFIWFLDQNSLIMNLDLSIEEQVTKPQKLDSLMLKDRPIVPPNSIIKTFSHLKGQDARFIISQDKAGLVMDSMVIRNGEWAKFFAETWINPLYRSYNFQKAERHALEHIVQWHPTILTKLALVPQRTLASYTGTNDEDSYRDGDFVAVMAGCQPQGPNSCEEQSRRLIQQLITKYGAGAEQKG